MRFQGVFRPLALGAISGLFALSLFPGRQRQETQRTARAVPVDGGSELSCSEVLRIGTWSEERYGGKRGLSLHAPSFGAEAAKEIAKRVDPSRLMLLQVEVDDFVQSAAGPWGRFLQQHDCAYFDQWIFQQRQRLQASFRVRIGAVVAKLSQPASGKAESADDMDTPRELYRSFARDEAELARRLETYAAQLGESASASLLAAYGGDRGRLISAVMERALFPESSPSRLVFAKGILAALDPYSTYFSADEFDDFYSDLSGGVSGIGVKVRRVPRGYLVEALIPKSAATESGKLEAGDLIIALDGHRLNSLGDREAKRLFKGTPNSIVRVTAERPRNGVTQVFLVTRRHFDFQESRVSGRVVGRKGGGAVGVIEVPSFYGRGGLSDPDERSSAEDFESALKDILEGEKPVSSLVVDLRGNPGGYLEEAVSMAGLFIANAPVVAVVGLDSQRILRADQAALSYNGPLVVLVDGDSASASEVLAGALKDHQRAVLVGTPSTYGKGSVQKLFQLGDEFLGAQWAGLPASGVVKLTTSVFYSPLGHTPANGGVQTHISIALAEPAAVTTKNVLDLEPFVDAPALARIGSKRQALEQRVNEIRLARPPMAASRFSPGEEAKALRDSEPKEVGLNQAMDIAAELAAIESRELKAIRNSVSRKP